jgi:hypothetical protein
MMLQQEHHNLGMNIVHVPLLYFTWTLKMEATCSSEP